MFDIGNAAVISGNNEWVASFNRLDFCPLIM